MRASFEGCGEGNERSFEWPAATGAWSGYPEVPLKLEDRSQEPRSPGRSRYDCYPRPAVQLSVPVTGTAFLFREYVQWGDDMLANGETCTRPAELAGQRKHRLAGLRQPRKIRYTAGEWAAIVAHARACGRPPARYVREISLGGVPKPRPGRANDEVIRELGRIGTVLTRLAAAAKEAGTAADQTAIEAVLADLLAAVRRLG